MRTSSSYLLITIYLLATLLLCFRPGNALAGISISPAFIELRLDKGVPAGQFLITNSGDVEERYRIKAIHFIFASDGGFREMPPDEHSLAEWVKFNPKEFTLPPQSRQAVRFVVTPRGKLKTGEYWAAMELESLKTSVAKSKDDKGKTYKFEVIPTIVVPIFAQVGDVRYMGTVKDLQVVSQENSQSVGHLVVNTGEGRLFVVGDYEIANEAGEVVSKDSLVRTYIMPGSERKVVSAIKDKLPPGNYSLKVQYNSSQLKSPLIGETKITVLPTT